MRPSRAMTAGLAALTALAGPAALSGCAATREESPPSPTTAEVAVANNEAEGRHPVLEERTGTATPAAPTPALSAPVLSSLPAGLPGLVASALAPLAERIASGVVPAPR